MTYEETMARYDDMRRNRGEAPRRIKESRFFDMFEVLFPVDWHRVGDTESFCVPECQTDDLYTFCARIGERHYELIAPKGTTHAQIIELCNSLEDDE